MALDVLMVAERVGVSASSLVRRFPHCFQQAREAADDLIEAAFAVSTEGEPRHVALKSVARRRSAV
ncbi:hypothetical protein [Streptomyces rubradiris]|uniref:TetR family transcriptional regulator n=1 Tax=Streptomyces rubradiris TaxID=285531 RepID=A0ABQ3RD87_STRRR|nr:hypothetical protein [Streptomyces rubradiris]GHG95077.1 hypothetical protein GCM10018792_05590 [Streptomyces rubradiris]GHI53821.1 hypothetical protein Srubr_36670 [Streptomyces rubradiris]